MPNPQTRHARIARLGRTVEWLQQRLHRLGRMDTGYTWLRVGIFVVGVTATLLTFLGWGAVPSVAVGAVTMAAFAATLWAHRRIERAIARHRAWQGIRKDQLARLTLDWDRLPSAMADVPATHPYAYDLDLVGPRSVARLIDRTATEEGSRRLLGWLLDERPHEATLRMRRARVHAMIPDWRLRDRLALASRLAAGERSRWRIADITDWLASTPQKSPALAPAMIGLGLWAVINVVLFILDRLGYLTGVWQVSWLLYFGLVFLLGHLAGDSFGEAMRLEASFRRLRQVLALLEERARHVRHTTADPVASLFEPLQASDRLPSRQIRRARWLVAAISIRGNPLAWIAVHGLVPWDLHFAWRLERLRRELNRHVPQWVDLIAELEALGALSDLPHLDPAWTMPRLLPGGTETRSEASHAAGDSAPELALADGHVGPGRSKADAPALIAVEGIAHPMIPAEGRASNDLRLEHVGQIGLITGSNMSGKSTFLRTVGLTAVLTMAGGPVLAKRAVLVPVRPYCSARIDDSVADGISFFYAEVRRLSSLLEALRDADPRPLLFLIDEIFRGTNNRERLIGSRAYLRALAGSRGTGLVATHDLELTTLADELPGVRNLHFRDDVAGKRMLFDYRLREGPCPTTNALRIMRSAGLPVPAGAEHRPSDELPTRAGEDDGRRSQPAERAQDEGVDRP